MWAEDQLNVKGTDADQERPHILALPNGGLAVTWDDATLEGWDGIGVRLSLYAPDGAPILQEWRVNDETVDNQYGGDMALLDGGFVVAFEGKGPDDAGIDDPYFDVFFQLYDFEGFEYGPEPKDHENVQITVASTEDQRLQDIATLADGSFVVAVGRAEFRTEYDIAMHRYDAQGGRIGEERVVIEDIDLGIPFPFSYPTPGVEITPLDDGGYILTWWGDPEGVEDYFFTAQAQAFDANGTVRGPIALLSGRGTATSTATSIRPSCR